MFNLELERKAMEFVKKNSQIVERIPIEAIAELREMGFDDGYGQWPSCKIIFRAIACRVLIVLYVYKSGCHFEAL